ncbi:MAG TPA: phosphoribosyltransferase family protein, partial [Acidimicrobiales bacterium]|nr:phosphoribosyltransferase family protein [Acidimicrobiales bacterium]
TGDGPIDAVAAVPSSRRATVAGRLLCPVDSLVAAAAALSAVAPVRLGRGPGSCLHLRPSADAFLAPAWVRGRRVLVVDDTWVTGARVRSAAAALDRAGAEVVGLAVVGRTVDPSCSPALSAWWASVGGRPLERAGFG